MAEFEVWYANDSGRVAYIADVNRLDYAAILGDAGRFALRFPARGQLYASAEPDRRILIYRRVGNRRRLEFAGLIDRTQYARDNGIAYCTQSGDDLTGLLRRRIVAYYAGSAQSTMSDNAGDIMREIVRDAFVDNADYAGTPTPSRAVAALSVAADRGDGATITKSFAWRPVLDVLQDIQAETATNGAELAFSVMPAGVSAARFDAFAVPANRSRTSSRPLVFSADFGNLDDVAIIYDRADEANAIYAGGRGEESARVVATAVDASRAAAGVYGRREDFITSDGETAVAVETDADAELYLRRTRAAITATLLATPITPYGAAGGWRLGDLVSLHNNGATADVMIRAIYITIDDVGRERIKIRAELI